MLASAPAAAADIHVVALTAGKAVVSINGGKPRALAVGQVVEGVKLLSADSQRRTLGPGEGAAVATTAFGNSSDRATLVADSSGHFITAGVVNGTTLRFLVDTGATAVVLSSADARRSGVNYLAGTRSFTQTANGVIPIYNVKIDTLRVGDITLNNVDAAVIEGDKLPIALLGMSFLNRMEMRREGTTMTLIRKY
jgi:aspartyl protease family protein